MTKYDPAHRDSRGTYARYECTAVSDIGKVFSGVEFTRAEYDRVERAYINAATAFMEEAGVQSLAVCDLERTPEVQSAISAGAI